MKNRTLNFDLENSNCGAKWAVESILDKTLHFDPEKSNFGADGAVECENQTHL